LDGGQVVWIFRQDRTLVFDTPDSFLMLSLGWTFIQEALHFFLRILSNDESAFCTLCTFAILIILQPWLLSPRLLSSRLLSLRLLSPRHLNIFCYGVFFKSFNKVDSWNTNFTVQTDKFNLMNLSLLCYLSIMAMGLMLLGVSYGSKPVILATVSYLFIHIIYKLLLKK